MYVRKCENQNRETKINKVCTIHEIKSPSNFNIDEYIDTKLKATLKTLVHLEKLISTLSDRIQEVEKNIAINELQRNVNKHYEQSRRH